MVQVVSGELVRIVDTPDAGTARKFLKAGFGLLPAFFEPFRDRE
jgi:hypothetical protein